MKQLNFKSISTVFLLFLLSNVQAQRVSPEYADFQSSCLLTEAVKQHTETISIVNDVAYIDDTQSTVHDLPNSLIFRSQRDGYEFIIRYSKIDPISGSSVQWRGNTGQAICSYYSPKSSTNNSDSGSPNYGGGSSGGCGSRGGPGYRRSDGRCAGWSDR
jgi:uncharacterized membrane protein YgcG